MGTIIIGGRLLPCCLYVSQPRNSRRRDPRAVLFETLYFMWLDWPQRLFDEATSDVISLTRLSSSQQTRQWFVHGGVCLKSTGMIYSLALVTRDPFGTPLRRGLLDNLEKCTTFTYTPNHIHDLGWPSNDRPRSSKWPNCPPEARLLSLINKDQS